MHLIILGFETHRRGCEREGTFGAVASFLVMLLDNLFG
mgnify:CR=1 FL=1